MFLHAMDVPDSTMTPPPVTGLPPNTGGNKNHHASSKSGLHQASGGSTSSSTASSKHPSGMSSAAVAKQNQVSSVILYGVPIVSLIMDGEERLCLAQISNTLLREFSYNEIHNRRVALGITCVQCTPVQLELLRRAGAMPVSSRRCGMITKREAERLCKSFLGDNSPPRLPDNFAFDVEHNCAWGCRGSFMPARYNSSRAKCIKCAYCGLFFSPNKFIFHSHRLPESKQYVQPDAANFNSWRRHMRLHGEPNEEITHAWEDVKAMFNGGTRKRMMTSATASAVHSSGSGFQSALMQAAGAGGTGGMRYPGGLGQPTDGFMFAEKRPKLDNTEATKSLLDLSHSTFPASASSFFLASALAGATSSPAVSTGLFPGGVAPSSPTGNTAGGISPPTSGPVAPFHHPLMSSLTGSSLGSAFTPFYGHGAFPTGRNPNQDHSSNKTASHTNNQSPSGPILPSIAGLPSTPTFTPPGLQPSLALPSLFDPSYYWAASQHQRHLLATAGNQLSNVSPSEQSGNEKNANISAGIMAAAQLASSLPWAGKRVPFSSAGVPFLNPFFSPGHPFANFASMGAMDHSQDESSVEVEGKVTGKPTSGSSSQVEEKVNHKSAFQPPANISPTPEKSRWMPGGRIIEKNERNHSQEESLDSKVTNQQDEASSSPCEESSDVEVEESHEMDCNTLQMGSGRLKTMPGLRMAAVGEFNVDSLLHGREKRQSGENEVSKDESNTATLQQEETAVVGDGAPESSSKDALDESRLHTLQRFMTQLDTSAIFCNSELFTPGSADNTRIIEISRRIRGLQDAMLKEQKPDDPSSPAFDSSQNQDLRRLLKDGYEELLGLKKLA